MVEQNYRIRIKFGEVEIEAEGDKDFVEKHVKELKEEIPKVAKKMPPEEKIITPQTPKGEAKLENLSLAEFYRQKQPKGHNETVVVFAYWLSKKENMGEFKPKDISACYDQARMPKPKNVRQHVRAVASGKTAHLTQGSKGGYYKLTLTGEEFVERELPKKTEA